MSVYYKHESPLNTRNHLDPVSAWCQWE